MRRRKPLLVPRSLCSAAQAQVGTELPLFPQPNSGATPAPSFPLGLVPAVNAHGAGHGGRMDAAWALPSEVGGQTRLQVGNADPGAKGGQGGRGSPAPGAGLAAPFTCIVWHCCGRHAPFKTPLSPPFSECPLVLLCLSARMRCREEECFPDGGEEVSLDRWTRAHGRACESSTGLWAAAVACSALRSSQRVTGCATRYGKHPDKHFAKIIFGRLCQLHVCVVYLFIHVCTRASVK